MTIDFTQDGIRYNADPMDMTTPDGRDIYMVRAYGKRGSLLKAHRVATRRADGTWNLGRWN
ncbi:hypothetical protein HN371_01090 [Candidatus Poribacteria bacterium]|nr:hypothetical protein [Candidatus Poribacteria bacterium]